jgi:hypothetical protein
METGEIIYYSLREMIVNQYKDIKYKVGVVRRHRSSRIIKVQLLIISNKSCIITFYWYHVKVKTIL